MTNHFPRETGIPKTTKTARSLRKLMIVFLLTLAVAVGWAARAPIASLMTVLGDQQAVANYVNQFGAFGPVVLFGLLVLQVFVAIIPGHALMMAAGYVYDPVPAIAITAASTILGSEIAFMVARKYGRSIVYRLAKPEAIQRWDGLAEKQGALFFFFTFILPIFPSDLMCYVAGLGKVSPARFLAANVAGRSFCAVTMILIGSYGFRPPWQFWAILLAGMAVLFLAWRVYKRGRMMPDGKGKPVQAPDSILLPAAAKIPHHVLSNAFTSADTCRGNCVSNAQIFSALPVQFRQVF